MHKPELECICRSTYDAPCSCGRAPVSRIAHITRGDSGMTLCDVRVETPQHADYVVLCQECASSFTAERKAADAA